MAIQLATKYLGYVDEVMKTASALPLVTNDYFEFKEANIVKIYKIGIAPMQDYSRNGVVDGNWSHYGAVTTLNAATEEMRLKKDRSFTFEIDKLDEDETVQALEAAEALNRQLREVVIPEVDLHVYNVMTANAGHKPEAVSLTADNIYEAITAGSEALDDAEVPEDGRFIIVSPAVLRLMKLNEKIALNSDIGADLRKKGAVAMLDNAAVIKVTSKRLPEGFGFLYGHASATVAPTKLADYKVHSDPPGLSGSLVEGRINYDAFVQENKAEALYYQAVTTEGENTEL